MKYDIDNLKAKLILKSYMLKLGLIYYNRV